jgi:hypothetical protein
MKDFIELIKLIGLPLAIIIIIIVIAGKYWIDYLISKRLEKERKRINENLEKFKNELQQENLKLNHSLNAKKEDYEYFIIKQLFKKIQSTHLVINGYLNSENQYTTEEKRDEQINKIVTDSFDKWDDVLTYFDLNKIYINSKLELKFEQIISLTKKLLNSHSDLRNDLFFNDIEKQKTTERYKKFENIKAEYFSEYPNLIKELKELTFD